MNMRVTEKEKRTASSQDRESGTAGQTNPQEAKGVTAEPKPPQENRPADREPEADGPGNMRIIGLLKEEFGVDFTKYKHGSFNRRMERRMLLGGFADREGYYDQLTTDPGDLNALFNDLLINVTQFFRDVDAFEALKATVYPRVLENLAGSEELRVWVVGCSTGGEAYSLAITLAECMDDGPSSHPVSIMGTDVSPKAIKTARSGSYPESMVDNVSEDRLRRFFTKQPAGYQVCDRISEMCTFSKHDVTVDAPPTGLDLISCRNLLIYLKPETQDDVISRFYHALKSTGFLFLGKSETVRSRNDLFKAENSGFRIYSKKTSCKAK